MPSIGIVRRCGVGRAPERDVMGSVVYRLGLLDDDIGVLAAHGAPVDQLGLDAGNGRFRALLGQWSRRCIPEKTVHLDYLDVAESDFGRRLRPAPARAYTRMPDIGAVSIENRFTDRFLVFGGRNRLFGWSDNPVGEGVSGSGDVVIVPIARPSDTRTIRLPHRVWRTDRIGENVLFTGYDDDRGLMLSSIDLRGGEPRLSSTITLEGRFESENRSHSFNSRVRGDGSGIAGLPTVLRSGDGERTPARSEASDLSFISIDAAAQLRPLGTLDAQAVARVRERRRDEGDDPAVYRCEMSCTDWYGNSRALFVGDRVFALTATELVEGRIADGRIGELQRIDLTKELPAHMRVAVPSADETGEPGKPGM